LTHAPPQLPAGLVRKLDEMSARLAELQKLMQDDAVMADHARISSVAREAGQLEGVIGRYRTLQASVRSVHELNALLGDPDMAELAQVELPDAVERSHQLAQQLQSEFVTAEDNKVESFFLEVRAGTGGEEAALFARDLSEMYRRLCETRGWSFVVSDYSLSERGGYKELIVNIKGNGAYRHLQYEAGGHRVQRVPETETQGRIHTSMATVAVLPELPDVKIEIDPKDIEEFGCRGGGPGGQNVNKVETGWFIRHRPSGLTFKMTEHKSQAQNKERAWALLRATLYEAERAKQHAAVTGARKSQMGSGDRSERVRTYNFPQNRCTDHRLGGDENTAKNFNLEQIVAGNMDELIQALIDLDTRQRLEAL
jgi:peptide chain release factor 1